MNYKVFSFLCVFSASLLNGSEESSSFSSDNYDTLPMDIIPESEMVGGIIEVNHYHIPDAASAA